MSKIELIEQVLNPLFKPVANILEEEKASMKIDLISSGCRFILFQMDFKLGKEYKGGLFPFFNSSLEKVCTVCDYIIFAEFKNLLFALIIELKKSDQNTLPQLKAGECFVDFVIATVNRMNHANYDIIKRKISIKEFKRKKKTKIIDIKYDENNHHFFEQNKFKIVSYLK